jgi:hypothetical protein
MNANQLFYHSTTIEGLYDILTTRQLTTPLYRKTSSTDSHGTAIYLTPIKPQFLDTLSDVNFTVGLIFSTRILEHPTIFINTRNAYGPLDGQGDREKKCNECNMTYQSGKTQVDGQCFINSIEEMLQFIDDNFNTKTVDIYDVCDGGPELGIVPIDGIVDIWKWGLVGIVCKIPETISKYNIKQMRNLGITLDDFKTIVSKQPVDKIISRPLITVPTTVKTTPPHVDRRGWARRTCDYITCRNKNKAKAGRKKGKKKKKTLKRRKTRRRRKKNKLY